MGAEPNAQHKPVEMTTSAVVGMILVCFPELRAASRARAPLEKRLSATGNSGLDTIVARVDQHHHTRIYDPRRIIGGTVTATITWGLFGLLTGGGVSGLISSAILGGILGGLGGYFVEHALSKSELTRIGARLPASSSALLLFVEAHNPDQMLAATSPDNPSVASAVVIDEQLNARQTGELIASGGAASDEGSLLSMIIVRYAHADSAATVANRIAADGEKAQEKLQVELIIRADERGRRTVSDPAHGSWAMAKGNILSWGVLGLIIGAITGAIGGGGVLGFLNGGLVTGLGYTIFGMVAGMLYGLWAGRATSAPVSRVSPR